MEAARAGGRPYWPTLDGVRGLAVAAVVAYHLGDLPGGWLGVDAFFVLSGYLITSLLLRERDRSGAVALGAFWVRRARRLLPAVLVLLASLSVYAWAGGAGVVPAALRVPLLATLAYGANWQQILSGHGYLAQFAAPTPLMHTWSLAIEEQYYVVWPLLFIGLTAVTRRSTRRLATAIAVLAAVSVVWMGVAAHLFGANRAYLGTDTRAWELLLGGLAAVLFRPGAPVAASRRWALVSSAGGAGVVVAVALAGGPPAWMWDGGLAATGVALAALIVGSVRAPGSGFGRLLSFSPLRWLGRVSYSLYLWHWPVIVLLNGTTTGLTGKALLATRLASMLVATCASYYVVERPLRHLHWGTWRGAVLVPASLAGTAVLVVAATVPPIQAAAAAVALPAAPPAPSPLDATTTTIPPRILPPGRTPSASDPLRVWIVGDSVMDNGAPGVAAALAATGDAKVVARTAVGGWGLSRDAAWPGDAAGTISATHPEVVVGTWSWDDDAVQADPSAYQQRLEGAITWLSAHGVSLVVLLQLPQIGPPSTILDPGARATAWARAVAAQSAWERAASQAAAALAPHVRYVRTDAVFAPDGRYLTWHRTPGGAWVRARKLDDTHLCPYGAAELGAVVVADIGPPLGLPAPASGWEEGAWSHDPHQYDNPVGTCPADQPPAGYAGERLPSA